MKQAKTFRDTYRVRNALKRLEKYGDKDLDTYIKPILKSRLGETEKPPKSAKTLIALSGGIDSKASALVAKEFHLTPEAVTFLVSKSRKEPVERFCEDHEIPLNFIHDNTYQKIWQEAEKKRFHPCGRCHSFIEEKIYEFAQHNGYKFVGFGDMLSVGSHAIYKVGELYRLNIPAMLSFTKEDHREITGEESQEFGCAFLKQLHEKYPFLTRYSIQRVMRELRSQCIDVDTAKKFIEDIEGDICS